MHTRRLAAALLVLATVLTPAANAAADTHADAHGHLHEVPVTALRAAYADAQISTARVVVPMVFPIAGGASFSDTFLACRSGCARKHFGQDLMAPKMRPFVATFSGRVSSLKRETTVGEGSYVTITSDSGWSANYVHVNNDTPGTDDGRGTAWYAFAPGLQRGMRVVQGQLLGYVGDSGNAEGTAPHIHFELRRGGPWDGVVYNPYPSLQAARRLATPWPSGPHPDGALIRAGAGPVWLVDGGQRRVVPPAVLRLNGWPAAQVITVAGPELHTYRQAPPVPPRDGLVLRAPDGALWVVADGVRHAVSAAHAAVLGVRPDRFRAVDAPTLALLPVGAPNAAPKGALRSGALLRTPDGRVWLADRQQVLRRIPDTVVLRSWGFAYGDYVDVPLSVVQTVLNAGEVGAAGWRAGAALVVRDGSVVRHPNGWMYVMSAGARRLVWDRRTWGVYGYARVPVLAASHVIVLRQPSGTDWPAPVS